MSNDNNRNPIDQIRDIVFGQNMTSYEERFQKIEALFTEFQAEVANEISAAKTDWTDQLKNTSVELLEKNEMLSQKMDQFKDEFKGFRKETETKISELQQTSLTKSEFAETLIEMSFRFTQDDPATSNSHRQGNSSEVTN